MVQVSEAPDYILTRRRG